MVAVLIVLSICIPTYNRPEHLRELLASVPRSCLEVCEFSIFNDGSDVSYDAVLSEFSDYNIVYNYYENRGRAAALKDSITYCSGPFLMIMDDDDHFVSPGFCALVEELREARSEAYLCSISTSTGINRAPRSNGGFLSTRVSANCWEDLKEVVRTDKVKAGIYDYPLSIRRVPTSLLWFSVSHLDCETFDEVVAFKNYLDCGMTKNIANLKFGSATPIQDLYRGYFYSDFYAAFVFRIIAGLKFGYYGGTAARHEIRLRICSVLGRGLRKLGF